MRKAYKFLIPVLALFITLSSFTTNPVKNDPDKDKVLISVINYMLTNGHYVPKDMDDDFSEHVFKSFIEGLDPSKRYFTKEDIREFSKHKYLIDNQLKNADLTFYHVVYNRFIEKIKSAKTYYGEILAQPFNFNCKR